MTRYQPQPYIPQAGTPPLEMPQYGISFGGAIARGFKKYTLFTGRASRSEFWWWYLFTNLVVLVLGFGGIILTSRDGGGTLGLLSLILGLLSVILFTVFALGIIVPTLAFDRPSAARCWVQRALCVAAADPLPGKPDRHDLRALAELAGWSQVRPDRGNSGSVQSLYAAEPVPQLRSEALAPAHPRAQNLLDLGRTTNRCTDAVA